MHICKEGVSPCSFVIVLIRPPTFSSKECSLSARRLYGPVFMRVRGHSRNDSRNVFVYCVLSRTYGSPANPISCSKH